MKIVIYDCEIKACIPSKKEPPDPGLRYCGGFSDFAGMGISLVTAYDYSTGLPMVFFEDGLDDFQRLLDGADVVVGFNNHSFDDRLIAEEGIRLDPEKSFDLLREIRIAAGLSVTYAYQTHHGYSLDGLCRVNLGRGKTGEGAAAPVLYQRGQLTRLVNYGLSDIMLTKGLLDLARQGPLVSPRDSSLRLFVNCDRFAGTPTDNVTSG